VIILRRYHAAVAIPRNTLTTRVTIVGIRRSRGAALKTKYPIPRTATPITNRDAGWTMFPATTDGVMVLKPCVQ
jgi:hypothetical protein